MSKYDKDREAFGISLSTSSPPPTKSKYDEVRMDYGMIPDTRPKNQPPTQAEIQRFGLSANPANSQVMQQAHQFAESQPKMNKERFKNHPSRKIPIIGSVLKTLDSFSSNPVVKKVSEIGRTLYTPGAGLSNVAGLTNAVETGIAKFAPKLASTFGGRAAQTAMREAVVGAPLGVGQSLATGHDDKEALMGGAYGLALGGALGGAGSAAFQKLQGTKFGDAVSSFFNRTKTAESPASKPQEVLALPPASRESMNAWNKRNGNVQPTNETPIYGRGEIHKPQPVDPLGLPEGNYTRPTRLKIAGTDDSFNAVIPKIFTQATERMTPPLENESLLTKWVQGHLNDAGYDISLNEVRGLNYEDLRLLAEEMRPRINTADLVQRTAHDMGYGDIYELIPTNIKERMAADAQSRVYGVPAPAVNIQKPNFNVQHVSDAAMPETKVKNIRFYQPSAKSRQTTDPNGARTDGLTIMEKYFPDGKVDTAILSKLPIEERLQFQKEQTPKNHNTGLNPNSQTLENLSSTPQNTSKYAADREQLLKNESGTPKESTVNNGQVVDDVVQTAEPRISDKVSGYLDEEIAAASERIKAKRYVASPDPAVKNADHALIGVTYIEKGTRKLSDFTDQMVRQFGEEIRPQVKEIFKQSKQIFKDTELRIEKDLQGLDGIVPAFLKDKSGFTHDSSDIYRVFKNVFQDKFPQMKKAILDPLDAAKMENVKMQEEWLNKMHTEVVENLGIEKGSKLSAYVQRFGEKDIDLLQLQKLAPKDWEKVVEADKFFRNAYDTLIDQVNATRRRIYPNNPDKIVPKRDDYYRHFQEFSGITGLKNIFDTPAGIDPHLVGVSENTLPKSKFAGFMQQRGLGKFKNDAVGGFLEYIPGASYATHIDPQISVFKNLSKNIASETEKSINLNNFIKFLQEYSQDLAGKTNNYDRLFQEKIPGGRKAFKVINWVNSRVKSNTILGNAGSAISQIANIPTGIAFAKEYALKGAGKTLLTAMKGNPAHEESQFLKERFFDKNYRKFDTRWLDINNPLKMKNAAVWVLETSDRMGTEFIWNSVYEKGLREGVKNPIKYADDETRRLVAGRGIAEVPLLQKSKVFQTIAPFTLEVANLWRVQKDFIKAKDFGGLALLMLGSYAFNKVAEEVKGSGVVFDPIQAMVEAAADDLSPAQRGGRLAGEVVSNIPLGGSAISIIYPEFGGEVLGHEIPTRKKLFGDNDPTRFGPGLIAAKGLTDPIFKLLPGFGGNQIKKSIDGVKAINKGGAYNGDELKAPIDMNLLKAAQSVVFGPNATKEMQTYFDKERRPLSEKQTKQIESLSVEDKKNAYESLQKQRKIESLKASYKKATEDENSTVSQKQKQVDSLIKKYNELIQAK
jgi:hypothetical protein